jgi:uncharacterized membrane-anchored protein
MLPIVFVFGLVDLNGKTLVDIIEQTLGVSWNYAAAILSAILGLLGSISVVSLKKLKQ